MSPIPTKTKILDTAERLFGEHGFAETSLRCLTSDAGVNLAAVHYHFGSKEELFRAVVGRLVEPINAERLRLLDELEQRSSKAPPAIRELVDAFLRPALEYGAKRDAKSRRCLQLMARVSTSPQVPVQEMREVFKPVIERFFPAFERAVPHLSPKTFHWRLEFLIGVLCMTLFNPDRLRVMSGGLCDTANSEECLAHMSAYITAGFEAADVEVAVEIVDQGEGEDERGEAQSA